MTRPVRIEFEATKTILESNDDIQLATLTKHDVVGDLIYGTAFSYFALNDVQDEIAQQSANIVSYRAPSYGMFTTTLETQYWFGVPRNVSFAGLSMDMDCLAHQTVDKHNNNANWINYNKSIGSRYSAMEHLVPEQMFSTETAPAEGVSAVKAIALASAEGQRIYTITADNVESALAAINIGPDTETEIRNAAYAGMQITTHQYQINFNGWVGEGYIIIDPETGAGAYKIAGGGNGSFLEILSSMGSEVFIFSLSLGVGALLLAFGGLLAASLVGAFIAAAFTIAYVQLMIFLAGRMDVKIDECINILANYILKVLAVLFVGVEALGAFAGATFSALLHKIFVSDDIDRACL